MNKFKNYHAVVTLTSLVLIVIASLLFLPSIRPVHCSDDDPQCAVLKERITKPRDDREKNRRDYYCSQMRERNCSEFNNLCGNNDDGITVSMDGKWNSNIGNVYNISHAGSTFSWTIEGKAEKGKGTIDGKKVSASWADGSYTGSATGNVAEYDANGRAKRIKWSNGVEFHRD